MNIIIPIVGIGIIAGFWFLLLSIWQKKHQNQKPALLAGFTIIAFYIFGHIIFLGVPKLLSKGWNISTADWNLVVAAIFFLPIAAGLAKEKIKEKFSATGKILWVLAIAFSLFLVLQVPYIQTSWPLWQSVITIIILTAVILGAIQIQQNKDFQKHNVLYLTFTTIYILTVSIVLLLSNTFTLAVLSGILVAILTPLLVLYFLLPRLGLPFPNLAYSEASSVALALTFIFLTEGHFFADLNLDLFIVLSVILYFPILFIKIFLKKKAV